MKLRNVLNFSESKLFDKVLNGRLDECLDLSLKKKDRALLLSIIKQYYQRHLDISMELKTLEILAQLYEE